MRGRSGYAGAVMSVHRRHAATTVAAIGLIVALTVTFAVIAVRQIATIDPGRHTIEANEARLGLNPQMANNATAMTAGLILTVCALTLCAAIGIARRNTGARYAATGLFGMLGFLAFAASLGGLTATPPSPNASYGLLCGVANGVILGLLLAPSTADDFERAEQERQWLRVRGYPLDPSPGAQTGGRGPGEGTG